MSKWELLQGVVYLGDAEMGRLRAGQSAVLGNVGTGEHSFEMRYPSGHKEVVHAKVEANSTTQAAFRFAFGTIIVDAAHTGVLSIDGAETAVVRGGEPHHISDVLAGNRNLELEYPSGRVEVKKITVHAEAPVQVTFTSDGKLYRIGDRGPAGGIVFYDKGYPSGGWQYLEAAPQDRGVFAWGEKYRYLGFGATRIGTGARNTAGIVKRVGPGWSYAAHICAQLKIGGYEDWFLPSKDELREMYRHRDLIGGFKEDAYFSSSEAGDSFAWNLQFLNGRHFEHAKQVGGNVRAVRAF